MTITKEHAARFLELCDAGLVKGLGVQEPGQMCIEACWNAALGLPHGDNPPCVGAAVRAAKIALNDADWSSNAARARGMRSIGIAQAGSDQIDQTEFVRLLQEGYAAFQQKHPPRDDAKAAEYTAEAAAYTARIAASTAQAAASAARAAENTAWAAECTAKAAENTAWAAECTARAADYTAKAAENTAWAAECTAWAAECTAKAATYTAKAAENIDEALSAFALVILDALKALKSPGCEFLDLIDVSNSKP